MSEIINDSYNDSDTGSSNNKALLVLFIAVFVDLLGFSLVIPLLPFWVKDGLGQSEFVYGILLATFSIFQFIFAPIWGKISDNIGRRPIILTGLVGTIIGFSLLSVAAFIETSLELIFIARAVSGIFTAATLPTSQAFISDSTTGKDRAKGFGLIGAAFGLGFTFGPAIGGIFFVIGKQLGGNGYILPTLIAVLFAVINLSLAFRNIPETLPKSEIEHRKKVRSESLTSKASSYTVIFTVPTIFLIILIFTILNLSFSAMESTFALFGDARFGLDEIGTTLVLLVVGIFAIITQGGLVRPLSNKYPDAILIVIGYVILVLGFIGLLYTYSFEMMILASIPLAVGSGLAQPTLASLLSKETPKEDQGAILGVNQSMASLMRIFGPLTGTYLLVIEPGLPYIFSIVLLVFCIILAIYLVIRTRTSEPKTIACHNCGMQSSYGVAKCSNCGFKFELDQSSDVIGHF